MAAAVCPNCGASLRGRVLANVPRADGQIGFRCPHCDAVIGYAEGGNPIIDRLWGTRARSLLTFVGGLVATSLVGARFGRTAALGVVGAVAAAVVAAAWFSPNPRYRVLEEP